MPDTIKSPAEIEKMREAGRLAADVLAMIGEHVKPGATTEDLDKLCHDFIVEQQKAIPANLGYRGFPKTICTSVNNVICHGIPSPAKVLKAGDIVNIDVTVIKDGLHGDCSRMFLVGEPSIQARRLVEVTYECMWIGIGQVRPGARLGHGDAVGCHDAEPRPRCWKRECGRTSEPRGAAARKMMPKAIGWVNGNSAEESA